MLGRLIAHACHLSTGGIALLTLLADHGARAALHALILSDRYILLTMGSTK